MSRNLTPKEMNALDVCAFKDRGEYIHDTKIMLRWGGQEVDMSYHRNEEVASRYPHLGFLFDDFVDMFEKNYTNNDKAKEALDVIEYKLDVLTKSDLAEDKKSHLTIKTEDNEELREVAENYWWLKAWYEGKLDMDFYYNERANQMFAEYLDDFVTKYPCREEIHDIEEEEVR